MRMAPEDCEGCSKTIFVEKRFQILAEGEGQKLITIHFARNKKSSPKNWQFEIGDFLSSEVPLLAGFLFHARSSNRVQPEHMKITPSGSLN